MGERVGNNVEILVHIAAPTTGKDDALYRALAVAYLDFETAKRVQLGDEVEDEPRYVSDEEAEGQLRTGLVEATLDDTWSREENDLIENEEDSYKSTQSGTPSVPRRRYLTRSVVENATTTSPGLSFNSVLDNADSPMLTRNRRSRVQTPPLSGEGLADIQGAHLNTPPSVVEDSQPTYDRSILKCSSPTTVLELRLQQSKACKSPATPRVEFGSGEVQETPLGKLITTTPRLETSVIIQTPEPTPSVVESPVNLFPSPREDFQQLLLLDTRKQKPAITPQGVSKSRKRSVSIPSITFQIPTAQPSSRTSQDTNKTDSPPRKRRAVSTEPPNDHEGLTSSNQQKVVNEIHPPPPITSEQKLPENKFPEIITESLADLSESFQRTSCYTPRAQTRPLRPLERGYWSVSMKDWEPKLQANVWSELEKYIAGGKAGWGVWCMRCEEQEEDGGKNSNRRPRRKGANRGYKGNKRVAAKPVLAGDEPGGERDADQPHPTHLRLYCWAEIARHTWLLLYLVSHKRIKDSPSEWIDGSGKPVIIMA